MCGRSARLVLLLFAFAPIQAYARNVTFFSGTPFGLGILGGIEHRPQTSFAAGNQTSDSNLSSYFGVEPFLDLGNVCFRAHVSWHLYPIVNGSGSDSIGSFTESSDAGSLGYGVRLELAPLVSKDARSRFFFTLGLTDAVVKLKNSRKYSTGPHAGTTYSEQVQGSGVGLNAGLGVETFLVQNWSIALEGGYADRSVDTFHYRTSTDVTGAAETDSSVAKDSPGGKNKGWHAYTPYGQVTLNLNL
jgi:hypothetical protein